MYDGKLNSARLHFDANNGETVATSQHLPDGVRRPQATCLAVNPRDLNIMLIGYEGGVVAWDFQKSMITKTFEMTLPPGM